MSTFAPTHHPSASPSLSPTPPTPPPTNPSDIFGVDNPWTSAALFFSALYLAMTTISLFSYSVKCGGKYIKLFTTNPFSTDQSPFRLGWFWAKIVILCVAFACTLVAGLTETHSFENLTTNPNPRLQALLAAIIMTSVGFLFHAVEWCRAMNKTIFKSKTTSRVT